MVDLPDPGVELIVGDGSPVGGLLIWHGLRGGGVAVLSVHALLVVQGGRGPVVRVGPGGVGGGRGLWAQGVGRRVGADGGVRVIRVV